MKSIVLKSTEYIFIILSVLAGYSAPFQINPLFLGIILLLVLQIIFKNRISGLILGILLTISNLFFLLALFSEFHEFNQWSNSALSLILVGLSIWLLTMALSLTMIYKYSGLNLKVTSR